MTPDEIAVNIIRPLSINGTQRQKLLSEIIEAIMEERRACADCASYSWHNLPGSVNDMHNYSVVVKNAAAAILKRPGPNGSQMVVPTSAAMGSCAKPG